MLVGVSRGSYKRAVHSLGRRHGHPEWASQAREHLINSVREGDVWGSGRASWSPFCASNRHIPSISRDSGPEGQGILDTLLLCLHSVDRCRSFRRSLMIVCVPVRALVHRHVNCDVIMFDEVAQLHEDQRHLVHIWSRFGISVE